jgi:transketolase C-terminal domain/subunit
MWLAAIGTGMQALGTAYGWYSSNRASEEAKDAARKYARAIEQSAVEQDFINTITEQRFAEEQSVQLGNISAGISKQQMSGTAGGEAYEKSAERTAAADIFLLKHKDDLQIQQMLAEARNVRAGGSSSAAAIMNNGTASTISNLGSMMFSTANWYDKWKTPTTTTGIH